MIHRILSITPTAWEPIIETVCGTRDNPADIDLPPCPVCRPDEHTRYMTRMHRMAYNAWQRDRRQKGLR